MTSRSAGGPVSDLAAATAFLTVVGGARRPTAGALGWFPIVGALVGAAVGLVWWGVAELWPPLVAAVLVVGVDAVVTGAVHHDGLADSADGLLPHLDRDRRLEVMAAPDVGGFGVVTVVVTIGLRVAVLAVIEPDPLVLAAVWSASRTAMAVVARSQPYARGEGLASSFLGGSPWSVLTLGAIVSAVLVTPSGVPGLVGLASLIAVTIAVTWLARRRLGGFTGDVLGAIGVLGETAALLALAANW